MAKLHLILWTSIALPLALASSPVHVDEERLIARPYPETVLLPGIAPSEDNPHQCIDIINCLIENTVGSTVEQPTAPTVIEPGQ